MITYLKNNDASVPYVKLMDRFYSKFDIYTPSSISDMFYSLEEALRDGFVEITCIEGVPNRFLDWVGPDDIDEMRGASYDYFNIFRKYVEDDTVVLDAEFTLVGYCLTRHAGARYILQSTYSPNGFYINSIIITYQDPLVPVDDEIFYKKNISGAELALLGLI